MDGEERLGGTVAHFPGGRAVVPCPATLPLGGTLKFKTVSKEKLLKVWKDIARKTRLKIKYGEEVKTIAQRGGAIEVRTTPGTYLTPSVLLAIGRPGTPRKLDVQGEDQTQKVYRVIDPLQY